MRTTLDLDQDVLLAVQERAGREKRSAGQALSELARQALTGQTQEPTEACAASPHDFRPRPHRGGPVSNALIDRLREEEP